MSTNYDNLKYLLNAMLDGIQPNSDAIKASMLQLENMKNAMDNMENKIVMLRNRIEDQQKICQAAEEMNDDRGEDEADCPKHGNHSFVQSDDNPEVLYCEYCGEIES